MPHAFERIVVQIYVRQLNFALRKRIWIDGKIVVMCGDFDLSARQLLHRMIPAMVAELQLEGLASQSNARELMPQTNPEDWLPSHQPPNIVDRVSTRLRIAWPVRQEHAVWLQRQYVLRRRLRRDHRHLAAISAQFAQDVLLDAEVVGNDVEAGRLVFYTDNFVRQVRSLARLPHIGMVGGD